MKNINQIKVFEKSKISEALKKMSVGGIKIVLVVNDKDNLIGTLSDGDIRRGLLNGLDLNSTIETVVYKSPTTAKISDTKDELLKLAISKQINQIPILDENNKIKDIFYLNRMKA